jgi:hypothetical protein
MNKQQAEDDNRAAAMQSLIPSVSKYVPQAQTEAGRIAGGVTDFAPAALFPGTALQRLGRVLKPGLASEGAGELVDNVAPDYAPAARIGAALLAGGTRDKGAPITSEAVGDLADKHFADFRAAPVTVHPSIVDAAAQKIQSDLAASGLSKAPANDMVSQYVGNKTPVSLNQLQETRSLLGKAASRSDTPEGVAAMLAKQSIDNLMDSITPANTVTGAAELPAAMEALRAGRRNTAVQRQLELVEGKQQDGTDNAAVHHVGDGGDNALRQQMNSLLKNRRSMQKLGAYSDDIRSIAHGTPVINGMRRVGQLTSGHNSFLIPLLMGETAISPTGGLATAGLMYGGGAVLRKLAARSTNNRIDALKSKIAGNAQGLAPQQSPMNQMITRALIASLAANNGTQRGN